MPVSTRAKWSQLKVGLMAVFALSVLGFLIFLLAGSNGLFKSRTEIYTYLHDSAAIAVSAPVRLNGITIGKVNKIALSGSSEPGRIVKLTMEIDNEYLSQIPLDSQAVVTAENLLGSKYININKGRGTQTATKGSEISSQDLVSVDDFVRQGNTALSAAQDIITKASGIVDEIQAGHGTIGKLLVDETLANKLIATVNEAQKLIVTLNKTVETSDNSVGKLFHDDGKLYDDVRGSLARVNGLIDGIEKGEGSLGKFVKDPALYDELHKTILDVRKQLADLDKGEGTLGKWLKKDDLHDQVQATLGRVDRILDKINNGQGTIGQLLNNTSLYESLDGTTRELHGLLKDFRSNPKKFLTIQLKLF